MGGLFELFFFPFIYWQLQGKDGRLFMKFRAVFFLERIDSKKRGVNDLSYKQSNKEVGAKANS